MRRVTGLLVVSLLALGTAASVATASPRQLLANCTNCGYVSAHGTGTITERATSGIGFATVNHGSIAIRYGRTKVHGASRHHWSRSLHAMVYTGKRMSFTGTGAFWVRIQGQISNFGSTARAASRCVGRASTL